MRFTHEYDAKGNHRLVSIHRTYSKTGEWAGYRDFAWLQIADGRVFICTTEFWAGNFKPDAVYRLTEEAQAETAESQVVEMPSHANDW